MARGRRDGGLKWEPSKRAEVTQEGQCSQDVMCAVQLRVQNRKKVLLFFFFFGLFVCFGCFVIICTANYNKTLRDVRNVNMRL